MPTLEQLHQQLESAIECRARLEATAFANPEPAIVEKVFEARRAEADCRAELQKALWLCIDELEAAA